MLPLARRRSTTESRTTDGRGWRVCLEPAAVQRRKEGAVARPHEEREASAARRALTKIHQPAHVAMVEPSSVGDGVTDMVVTSQASSPSFASESTSTT